MNPYNTRDQSGQQTMQVAMSPRPGGPPPQQLQHPGPPGIGMGRGASNTGLQNSALALANNPRNPGSQQLNQEESHDLHNELLLNSYIYDHLLKSGFQQAARGLMNETNLLLVNNPREESSPNQDGDGNSLLPRRATTLKRSQSSMDHPNSSPNDKPNGKSPGSGSNSPHNANSDLPAADTPLKGGFLREWWSVFWDIYAARGGLPASAFANAYLESQRNLQRMPQYQTQFNPDMQQRALAMQQQHAQLADGNLAMQQRAQLMNGIAEDVNVDKSKTLMHTAIVNNGRKVNRPGQQPMPMQQSQPTSQAQMMALKQQQQQAQQLQQQQHQQAQQQAHAQAQQQQQRDNDSDPNSSSPALGQANSPNKRQRLTPPGDSQGPGQIPSQGQNQNGLQATMNMNAQMVQTPSGAISFLRQNGFSVPMNSSNQDIMGYARQLINTGNFQTPGPSKQQLQTYKQNLANQQSQQGLVGRAMPGAASPAGQPASIPFATAGIAGGIFGAREDPRRTPTQQELDQMSKQASSLGGALQHPQNGSHSLQDYQNQLMVLELQNKRRLQHARGDNGNRIDEPGSGPLNGQFSHQQGQGLQPGHPQLQGTNMSPSNSRAGPSPQISNLELAQQQRKAGQKTGSGAASPEPGDPQLRGPSPAFNGQAGGMTQEQYHQMTQMAPGYQQGMLIGQNGQPQFIPGRPHPGIPLNQAQNPIAYDLMRQKMQQQAQAGQPGQPFQGNWPQAMINQPMNQQMRQPGMVPGQQPPQNPPATVAQQQMPPPPQPQQTQPGRQQQAPSESPSLANAQPPTPTPGNKPAPKTKTTKEPRAKRNRGKNAPAPATPNAAETPTPTTPITPHAPAPFPQAPAPPAQASQTQQQQPPPPAEQPSASQDTGPPSAFGVIDASDSAGDVWGSVDESKWMDLPMDFPNNFNGNLPDFGTTGFGGLDDNMVNYSEFLNDNDTLNTMDMGTLWDQDLGPTET